MSKKKAILEDSAENLAIEEESSSLKSVSPLTENSLSKKSLMVAQDGLAAQKPPLLEDSGANNGH